MTCIENAVTKQTRVEHADGDRDGAVSPSSLHGALYPLLADTALRARLTGLGGRIRARGWLRRGANVIESIGRRHADRVP